MNVIPAFFEIVLLFVGITGILLKPKNLTVQLTLIMVIVIIVATAITLEYNDAQSASQLRYSNEISAGRLLDENRALERYVLNFMTGLGFKKTEYTKEDITRSVDANNYLSRLQIITLPPSAAIRFECSMNDLNERAILNVLKGYGFQITMVPVVNNAPINRIEVGEMVTLNEAKTVAFALIRAGVGLRTITRVYDGSNSFLIRVEADSTANSLPVLSPYEINAIEKL